MIDAAASVPPPQRLTADVAGHRLELLFDGADRLTRLCALIDGAARSIDIIMYIFDDDPAGREVVARLVDAAGRGVRVRAVIDSFGSSDTPDSLFAPLRAAGGEVIFFSRRWRSSYLIRNHQKLILFDGTIAVTGGFNIAEHYLSPPGRKCWFDLGLVVEGPSVAKAAAWFEQIHAYTVANDGKLLMLRRMIREWPAAGGPVAWLVGGPTQRLSPWARAVRRDLDQARRLDMAMAYFSPGQGMLRRLGRVARQGHARLVMAGRSDNAATVGASRLLYGYLLRKRAEVWEYQPCKLHLKLIVIDNVTYIGSANFDARSLFVNVEVMLRIDDAEFAATMRDFVAGLEPDCEVITRQSHKARAGWLTRLRWTLAWFVVGVADYTVSRRLNFGLAEPDLETI
ncbi:phosphatidylserine/phosphatidylglycerophosphate/cardiolipin synthase family protein [Sphingopyxis sp. GW247-27LB]|uniref:phospholipase D-like domain-containing protein n=1 Tax=Sphingopyxis sp. GW247-27LB TaxID=2012632 RepID=UPI000BA5EA99|nr:phosphatidylserine/phosphatidylglycerophosphate/cardiolipin synthase family protein [Sphingopyxis sp. GW247-27LB]PAL24544.1 cardiolipin synthase B [Sphingopyxis sp. GW247-27LB]